MTTEEKQATTIKKLRAKMRKMDKELTLVHEMLAYSYECDHCHKEAKSTLRDIDKLYGRK